MAYTIDVIFGMGLSLFGFILIIVGLFLKNPAKKDDANKNEIYQEAQLIQANYPGNNLDLRILNNPQEYLNELNEKIKKRGSIGLGFGGIYDSRFIDGF